MKKIFLKSVLALTVILGTFSSCVNDDSYGIPDTTLVTYELTTTTTVAAVKADAPIVVVPTNPTVTPVPPKLITSDDIIEAYVTSSDSQGIFYKSISFQTIPTDGSNPIGFSVPINATTLFGKGFTPGRKVYIKLKGLYKGIVYGSLQIGSLFEGTVGRISEFEYQNHLFPSATIVPEADFVRTMTLAQAYLDVNQNTLVELTGVQFSESSINRTYYDVDSGGGATNHLLASVTGGTERIIRFSSFAPFTGKQVPKGSGKIRGVLTKYNTDFQFMIRYESDINLAGARVDASPAIIGNANVFSATVNENFTPYTLNQSNFPKYINDAFVGSRYWQVKNFSSNNYIEMTSYVNATTPGVQARTMFYVPVDFTAANTFTFKKEIRFNAGVALKVYYVRASDHAPGAIPDFTKFTDITTSLGISYPAMGASESAFSNVTNPFAIPASLTGNGYFVFEYVGGGTVTTTVQIDDIVIN